MFPPDMGAPNLSKLRRFTVALLMTGISLTPVTQAHAAYDHPVTWADMADLDLRRVFRTHYVSSGNLLDPNVTDWSLDLAMRDADERVADDFSIPADLKPAVRFWLRIYTEFTTRHVVLFDSRHPEIIYEVLDFRELSEKARNAVVYELTIKKRVKAAMAAYRQAFARLSRNPKSKPVSREEKIVQAALQKLKHKHTYLQLAKNIRSQTGQRDNIVKGLLAAEAYFPKMEELFRQSGVPPELTRLSLVESSFNLHATSRVGAAGVWQFMPNPGRKYLLIDDRSAIDERLSPLKSTVAAAKLLKENYKRFHSWALSVTSYNHGLRGLTKFRRQSDFSRIAHLFDPCNKRTPLGWAARNYYAEFLAVLHAESYRTLFYGNPPVPALRPVVYRRPQAGKNALALAMENGVSIREFRLMNPDIRDVRKALPPSFYVAFPSENDDLAALTAPNPRKQIQVSFRERRG